jgi:hypothetical protein
MSPEPQPRSDLERHNNLIFIAILVALVLSFFDGGGVVLMVETAARVVVVVLVVYGLVRWKREYFSHWTSWLSLLLALVSAARVYQLFVAG